MKKNNRKVAAIIQARMGSSRLPGKVLKNLSGKAMLAHVYDRIRISRLVDQIIVATTDDESDDQIAQFCEENKMAYFRGHQFDVLDRFYQASLAFNVDIIVRITADCPLLDPTLMDDVIQSFFDQDVDFATNRLPPPWKRSYPIGLDVEVCSFVALEKAWKEATLAYEREHVLPYLYDQPERFKTLLIHHDPDFGYKRWTVDTLQDLQLVEGIIDHFHPNFEYSWKDVLNFLQNNPELEHLNQAVFTKSVEMIDERALNNQGNTNK